MKDGRMLSESEKKELLQKAYEIRLFRPEDAAAVCSWLRSEEEMRMWSAGTFEAFPLSRDVLNTFYTAHNQKSYYPLMLSEERGGEAAGHVLLRLLDTESHTFRLAHYILRPELRGMGLGKVLLRKIIDFARSELQAERLILVVFTRNLPAYFTYRALGFRRSSENNEYYRLNGKVREFIEMELDL